MYLLVECLCWRVQVFVIYLMVCNWRSSQDVKVLLTVLCSLSRGFQVGVYSLSVSFRAFSPCVLVSFRGLVSAGRVCSGGRLLC